VKSERDQTVRETTNAALARTEAAARGGRAGISAGEALLGALSQVSPSRWSFLVMAVVLALALLLFGPRWARTRSF